jgi:hypothetical protein
MPQTQEQKDTTEKAKYVGNVAANKTGDIEEQAQHTYPHVDVPYSVARDERKKQSAWDKLKSAARGAYDTYENWKHENEAEAADTAAGLKSRIDQQPSLEEEEEKEGVKKPKANK